jgi:hypothetical protein
MARTYAPNPLRAIALVMAGGVGPCANFTFARFPILILPVSRGYSPKICLEPICGSPPRAQFILANDAYLVALSRRPNGIKQDRELMVEEVDMARFILETASILFATLSLTTFAHAQVSATTPWPTVRCSRTGRRRKRASY